MNIILLNALIKCGAIKSGNFVLKSGRQTDIYCDIRVGILNPVVLEDISLSFDSMIYPFDYDCVGCDEGPGPSTLLGAMLPILEVNGFVVRKEVKTHGTGREYEGTIGRMPILIEDVVTTGQSIMSVVNRMPVKPRHVFCVVDREEGGEELLMIYDIKLHSLYTLTEIRNEIRKTIK